MWCVKIVTIACTIKASSSYNGAQCYNDCIANSITQVCNLTHKS